MSEQAGEFKAGDVVKLKSGGPLMTVNKLDGMRAFCCWFGENNQVSEKTFDTIALKIVVLD